MTTSPEGDSDFVERYTVHLTGLQRRALVEIVERAEIRGRDAPLVTGILERLLRGEPIGVATSFEAARERVLLPFADATSMPLDESFETEAH
jgi:hypothetical protein